MSWLPFEDKQEVGGDFKLKKYMVLIIGIAELTACIIWVLLSQPSTGWIILLAGLGGFTIGRGIAIIKHKK